MEELKKLKEEIESLKKDLNNLHLEIDTLNEFREVAKGRIDDNAYDVDEIKEALRKRS